MSETTDDQLRAARELALGGLFGALGIALPLAFHAAQLGKMMLPMHFPILILGLLVRPAIAGTVGAIVPLLSALLTGMPPLAPPTAIMMCFELAALGATASVLASRLRWNPWAASVGAILVARTVLGLAVIAVGPLLGFRVSAFAYVAAAVVAGLPGIIIQLATIPLLITWLRRVGAVGTVRAR